MSTSGELDDGRWVPVPRSSWRHGQLVGNACVVLGRYAKQHPGWSVSVGNPGTKLARNPDRLRGPDVGMVGGVVLIHIGDAHFGEFNRVALR